ncbi:ABC transporter ATP-binding protein [Brucella intermedia]|uniref:ABC transporter ATP-binding protein n=1 Tax=Brucella intermedia TaxID=94625 RepID=UPI0022498EAF|nr:ABC transporter ATP-binding protein [Brucella intermedia]
MSSSAIVSLDGVRKVYGDVAAVETFSLDMHQGEIVCLLGPSGCGKTTTLRMLAGFVQPTEGAIRIAGTDVTRTPPYRRDTGMVFQSYGLFPHMTVAQNIAYGLDNRKIEKKAKQDRVEEMLNLVELVGLRNRYPRELSGGQQQRVALARALAVQPAVLLLDEPFGALDARLRLRLRDEMHALIKSVNITTLFVTHDQEEALAMADRIVVMSHGVVEQIGTPLEIYDTPKSQFVAEFIGACNILPGIVDADSRLIIDPGVSLPSSAAPGNYTVAIRPEAIKMVSNANGPDTFNAKVLSSTYLGHAYRTIIQIGALELLMDGHFDHGVIPAHGTHLHVTLDADRVRLLPPRT